MGFSLLALEEAGITKEYEPLHLMSDDTAFTLLILIIAI
jgi:hypothetical protein